jgi:hypothetical protein
VKRAADLYAEGRALRQIGAELGVHWSTVSQHLQSAGVKMRRGGPPAHPASTQQILQLRDEGLSWNQVAKQVDMTVSGVWSRYRRARPPGSVFAVEIGTFPPRRTSSFRARFLDGALVVVDQEDQRGREDHEEQS